MEQLYSFYRLASMLAGEKFLRDKTSDHWIITGAKGVGKTTFCQKVIQKCRLGEVSLGGILSRARFEGAKKTGIYLENLASGQQRLLAQRDLDQQYKLKVGSWYFDPTMLEWGNICLEEAAGCDVVIFDECGILEFKHDSGFQAGLELMDSHDYRLGLVVVRPALLPLAQARWPEAVIIDFGEGNRS